MFFRLSLATALASLVPALALAGDFGTASFHYDGKAWHPAFLQCDMTDHVAVTSYRTRSLADYVKGQWGDTEESYVYNSFQKSKPSVKLTLTDSQDWGCGMGKCIVSFKNGQYNYNVTMSHAGNYDPNPGINPGHIDVTKTGQEAPVFEGTCRTFPRTQIACVTKNRTVYVSAAEDGSLEYRTFDFGNTSSTPSLYLRNGMENRAMGGKVAYEFSNGNYAYSLYTSQLLYPAMTPFATLTVSKNGKAVATESCTSYTLSQAWAETP